MAAIRLDRLELIQTLHNANDEVIRRTTTVERTRRTSSNAIIQDNCSKEILHLQAVQLDMAILLEQLESGDRVVIEG